MIAVKIGTVSWRSTQELAFDEVEFTGEFLYESDGFTPAMVWDDALQNVRAMNQTDRDARNAEIIVAIRAAAEAIVDASTPQGLLQRAILLTILDALNRQSRQFRDLLAAIAAAGSLTALRTAAGAISPVEPARTATELKGAVKAKATAGLAD